MVEPLICVHDALVAQASAADDSLARRKLKEWFQNELELGGGLKMVIPVDGAVAGDWGMKWPCPACQEGYATMSLDSGLILSCKKCDHTWMVEGGEKL